MYGWGSNKYGKVGADSLAQKLPEPALLHFGQRVAKVRAGGNHSLAVGEGGEVWAWGLAENYQLGTAKTANEHSPQRILFKKT